MTATIRTAAVAVLAVLALSACGGSDAPTSTNEPIITAPSAGSPTSPWPPAASAGTSVGGGVPSAPVAPQDVTVTGEPAEVFGAAEAKAAVETAYEVAESAMTDSTLLTPRADRTVDDFATVTPYLTADALAYLTEQVAAGDPDGNVASLALYQDASATFIPVAPFVVAHRIGAWTATVDRAVPTEPALAVTFRQNLTYTGEVDGQSATYPVQRDWSLTMVPTGDPAQPWKVATWASTTPESSPTVTAAG